MEGLKWSLRFHQNDLHLCSEDEQKSTGLEQLEGYIMTEFLFIWENYHFHITLTSLHKI